MPEEDKLTPVDLSAFCEGWELGRIICQSIDRKHACLDPNSPEGIISYIYGEAHEDLGALVSAEQVGSISGSMGILFTSFESLSELDPTEISTAVDRAKRALHFEYLSDKEPVNNLEEHLLQNGFLEQDILLLTDRIELGHMGTDRYFIRSEGDDSLLLILDSHLANDGIVGVYSRLSSGDEVTTEDCYFALQRQIVVSEDNHDKRIAMEISRQLSFIDQEFLRPKLEHLDLSEILPDTWQPQEIEFEPGVITPVYLHPDSDGRNLAYIMAMRGSDGDVYVCSENLMFDDGASADTSTHQEYLTYSGRDLKTAVLSHADNLQVQGVPEVEMDPQYANLDSYFSEQGFERAEESGDIELGDRSEFQDTDVYFFRERGDLLDVVVLGYGTIGEGFIDVQYRILISHEGDLMDLAKYHQTLTCDQITPMAIVPMVKKQMKFMGREYMSSTILAPPNNSQVAMSGLFGMLMPSGVDDYN